MRRLAARALIVVALSLVALSGCGQAQPGGDERRTDDVAQETPTDDVADAVDDGAWVRGDEPWRGILTAGAEVGPEGVSVDGWPELPAAAPAYRYRPSAVEDQPCVYTTGDAAIALAAVTTGGIGNHDHTVANVVPGPDEQILVPVLWGRVDDAAGREHRHPSPLRDRAVLRTAGGRPGACRPGPAGRCECRRRARGRRRRADERLRGEREPALRVQLVVRCGG